MPPLVTLIAGLTLEGFKLWQVWCRQNPGASNEDAAAQLQRLNDSDAAARDQHAKSQAKADELREKLGG